MSGTKTVDQTLWNELFHKSVFAKDKGNILIYKKNELQIKGSIG